MRTDEPFWAPLVGALLLVALLLSLALVSAGGWQWFSNFLSDQAASWAQAVFGAIAIIAAYRMGSMQMVAERRRDARQRVLEELHRLNVLTAILRHCRSSVSQFERHWSERNFLHESDVAKASWSTSRTTIAEVDPFVVPGGVLVVYLLQVPRRLDSLLVAYDAYATSIGKADGSLLKTIPALRNELSATCALLDLVLAHISDATRECIASLPADDLAEVIQQQKRLSTLAARASEQMRLRQPGSRNDVADVRAGGD